MICWSINLAVQIANSYTIFVKSRKYIHALLIVALCYGQLVANVHLVGHLHADDCEGSNRTTSIDCGIDHHSGEGHDHSGHSHQNIAHNHNAVRHIANTDPNHQLDQKTGEKNTDSSCAIYHALLNLDGAVSSQLMKCSIPRIAKSTSYAVIQLARETPGALHIRAPPQHS